MIDWLKKRLSPVKIKTDRWAQLAEAIQEFWEDSFDPELEKVANLRSIYTAGEDGQKRIVSELGRYYEYDLPDKNIPISVALRKLELLQKDTKVPLVASLKRLGIDSEWMPMYARRGEAYGTAFYMDHEIDPAWTTNTILHLDGSWHVSESSPEKLLDGVLLTSRGKLLINLASLSNTSLIDTARDRVRKIKPLHIVFDGFYYQLWFDLDVYTRIDASLYLTKTIEQQYPWCNSRLDGSWQIGFDDQPFTLDGVHSIDGSWKLGAIYPGHAENAIKQCNIISSAALLKTIDRPAEYINSRLGESMLRLDGGWNVGDNRILALSETSVKKEIEFLVRPDLSACHVSKFEISYPASPVMIGTQHKLFPGKPLDASWRLGAALSPRKLDGAWAVKREPGIRVDSSVNVKKEFSCGIFPGLGRAMSKIGESWSRRIDGNWKVGAHNDLDGTWQLDGNRYLTAPALGRFYRKLNGSWGLGYTKKLDSSWKVGASGPECEMELIIRKAA